jgi:hypothetical protein
MPRLLFVVRQYRATFSYADESSVLDIEGVWVNGGAAPHSLISCTTVRPQRTHCTGVWVGTQTRSGRFG